VEGNTVNNDWWAFEQRPGAIRNGHRVGSACDWWRNAEADFDRMAELAQNAHRLSVEWSRLEPEEGRVDDGAVRRYRQMLQGLRDRGIAPLLTLHHFTLPLWVARSGGWENPRIVAWMGRYARWCAGWFGDLVEDWIPINEPNLVVVLGYLLGRHPPGIRNPLRARRVVPHLLRAHAAAYRAIHAEHPAARVGTAHHLRLLEPARPHSLLDRAVAAAHSQFVNWMWLDVLAWGEGRSALWSGRVEECAGTMDFVGINYYTADRIRAALGSPGTGCGRVVRPPGVALSDGGYGELRPDGLRWALAEAWRRYGLPLCVTENGLPDEDDDQRPGFLLDHVEAVRRAQRAGIPVWGYYHWSLVDNFEWAEGWTLKFGLIAVDPVTQRRTERPSARLYREICRGSVLPR
jgi:beta-glucosidase